MKKVITFIFIVMSFQISAQEFAPIGSVWHYDLGTESPDLIIYKTIESIKDTIIKGIECKKLLEIKNTLNDSRVTISSHYMYSKNDSIFIYSDNQFKLLYDFGAQTGETITLGINGTSGPLEMIIDSTETIELDGQSRKIQYVTCGDGLFVEFGGAIISGIGNTNYMFPTFDMNLNGPLRCYSDSTTSFVNPINPPPNWNQLDCNQIYTLAIEELFIDTNILIYPNPVNEFIKISNLDRSINYNITDVQGKQVKKGVIKPLNDINLKKFAKGVYFLQLKNDIFSTSKIIIKN